MKDNSKVNIMKHTILTLIFVLSPFLLVAQPHGQRQDGQRFDPQKFQQMVEQALTKAGQLTEEEARTFFPLYNEMRSKQREMGRRMHELRDCKPSNAKACAETIIQIKRLQVEMAELERDYYKRILKQVPAEKVFKMMKAEDDFHRRMVKRQNDHNRHQKDGRDDKKGGTERR